MSINPDLITSVLPVRRSHLFGLDPGRRGPGSGSCGSKSGGVVGDWLLGQKLPISRKFPYRRASILLTSANSSPLALHVLTFHFFAAHVHMLHARVLQVLSFLNPHFHVALPKPSRPPHAHTSRIHTMLVHPRLTSTRLSRSQRDAALSLPAPPCWSLPAPPACSPLLHRRAQLRRGLATQAAGRPAQPVGTRPAPAWELGAEVCTVGGGGGGGRGNSEADGAIVAPLLVLGRCQWEAARLMPHNTATTTAQVSRLTGKSTAEESQRAL